MTTNPRPRRRRGALVLSLALVGVLALASCSDNKSDSSGGSGDSGSGGKIRISSQTIAENRTLAQVYGQYLQKKGFDVDIQDPIGTRTQIYAAFKQKKLDLEIDYSGSAVVELKGTATNDSNATYETLAKLLKPLGLEASKQAEGEDANALVALKSWADSHSVKTISDLSNVDDQLTLGGAAECADRDDCLKGYNGPKYALGLKFKVVDYGPPLVEALKANEIQVAQYGSTAAELSTGQIVALEDDQGLQSAQNVVPILRTAVSTPALTKALDTISAKVTDKVLAGW